MKIALFYISFLFITANVMAQKYDSWEIFHNRKKVAEFSQKKETDDERRILLLRRALDEPGFFIITYSPMKDQADWIRSFVICDSSDKELKKFNNLDQLKMLNGDISRFIGDKQKVRIYSWATPKDPDLAATVRVRRILLCTIYTR